MDKQLDEKKKKKSKLMCISLYMCVCPVRGGQDNLSDIHPLY